MNTTEKLSIWYISGLKRCNFNCSYCSAGQPLITDNDEWLEAASYDVHLKTLNWITNLPYQVRLRMGSIGEPFVSNTYMDSVAELSHSKNLEYVEILTNGSYSSKFFMNFIKKSNPSKLSFWMTYHPTEIGLEKFVNAAILAKEQGVHVIVHALLFPDSVESTKLLKSACEKNNLSMHVGLGLNFNDAYPNKNFIPILDGPKIDQDVYNLNVAFPDKVYTLAENPLNAPCSAGHDYIYINRSGDVHQCRNYFLKRPENRLGSTLDINFIPKLRIARYARCQISGPCVCIEDYQHLEVAEKCYTLTKPSFIPCSKADLSKRIQ